MQKFESSVVPRRLLDDTAAEGALSVPGLDELLSTDMSKVDTSFPLIKEGLYDVVVDDISLVDNKAKTGKNIMIKLKTTAQTQDVKGNVMNPGMVLTTYIALAESEKYDKEAIKRNVATFVQSVGQGITQLAPLDQFKGKIVRVKVKVRPPEGQYEAANDVRFVPLKD
jgi:hypothetical protein